MGSCAITAATRWGLDPTAVRSERCQTATMAAVKSEYTTILAGIRLLPDSRTKILFLTGVFIVCMCSLMLQVMETRLLSVIAWYYLAFFAISMAMFGMTAGSLFVYFKSELFSSERLQEYLGCITVALAISVVFSTVSLVSSVVLSGLSGGTMLLWLKLILSILPPYVFAGMAISLALTRRTCLRLLPGFLAN